jgi:hypothetical protein
LTARRPRGCVQPPNRRENADDRPHRLDLPEHLRPLRSGNEHVVVSVPERAQGNPGKVFWALAPEASLRGHHVGAVEGGQSGFGNPAVEAIVTRGFRSSRGRPDVSASTRSSVPRIPVPIRAGGVLSRPVRFPVPRGLSRIRRGDPSGSRCFAGRRAGGG